MTQPNDNPEQNTPTVSTPLSLISTDATQLDKPVHNDVIEQICSLVALSGKSLSVICTDFGIDCSVVYRRAMRDPHIAELLARMRQQRAHTLADGLTDALDTVKDTLDPEDNRKNDISIRYTDMRLRHVQWLIERTNPEYSNKQEIRIGPADSAAAIEEAWKRRQSIPLAHDSTTPDNPTIQ